MAVELPVHSREALDAAFRLVADESLGEPTLEALRLHYEELRRWGRRLSLIGPGTAVEVLDRHYGESLAVLPWCPTESVRHVDLGSGGGFPGLVIAATRPAWHTTLVEPRGKKASFLEAVARKTQLNIRVLNDRVDERVPSGFPGVVDLVTIRALQLSRGGWEAVVGRLASGGRVFWWQGQEGSELPPCLRFVRELPLGGSDVRRVVWAEAT